MPNKQRKENKMALKMKEQSISSESKGKTAYPIIFIMAMCHLLNDSLQAVIPAMFPILEKSLGLTFTQLGLIAFVLNMASSMTQPLVGMYTDKRPMPYALPIGLAISMFGILGLAYAPSFWTILICVLLIGLGSAIFHPEGSRVAYLAAGSRRGLAQSIYQVGGNTGHALAPIITALVLVPLGQFGVIWFTLSAGIAIIFLLYISKWYAIKIGKITTGTNVQRKKVKRISKAIKAAIILLVFLVFIRSWYMSAISNFYAFYVIDHYEFTIAASQMYTFTFLFMGAIGTFFGGPLADRFGKRNMIIISLIVPVPLALCLPHVGPIIAIILLAFIGFLLMSSFSVTVVYAQELIPGKVATMSGLIVGLAFGMGTIGSVALGSLIDAVGLTPTMLVISFIPLLGALTYWLPSDQKVSRWNA